MEEVFSLFLDYLRESPTSLFKKLLSLYARKEYQKDRGNLSHIHLIAELSWRLMSTDEKNFVNNLIHASIYYIVKSDEIQRFIDEGVFKICE